jgi:hypothetical protein
MSDAIEIFFSYAHEDEALMNEVRRQLVVEERNGRIIKWHDRLIPPGATWRRHIDQRLERAAIILVFVSPHFIESKYCYEVEGQAALRLHQSGKARLVPVILRPCLWQRSPFGELQALPRNGRPLSRWEDRDEACLDVAVGVMSIVDALDPTRGNARSTPAEPVVSAVRKAAPSRGVRGPSSSQNQPAHFEKTADSASHAVQRLRSFAEFLASVYTPVVKMRSRRFDSVYGVVTSTPSAGRTQFWLKAQFPNLGEPPTNRYFFVLEYDDNASLFRYHYYDSFGGHTPPSFLDVSTECATLHECVRIVISDLQKRESVDEGIAVPPWFTTPA